MSKHKLIYFKIIITLNYKKLNQLVIILHVGHNYKKLTYFTINTQTNLMNTKNK